MTHYKGTGSRGNDGQVWIVKTIGALTQKTYNLDAEIREMGFVHR